MSDLNNAIAKVIVDIEQYYDLSFRMWPEKCVPAVFVLIGHIEDVLPRITDKQIARLNRILQTVVEALESKDYVRMRDYLYYDLRELLISIQSGKSNKQNKKKQ